MRISHRHNLKGIFCVQFMCNVHEQNGVYFQSLLLLLLWARWAWALDVYWAMVPTGCWRQVFASILRFFWHFSSDTHNFFFALSPFPSVHWRLNLPSSMGEWILWTGIYSALFGIANTHQHHRCRTSTNFKIEYRKMHRMHARCQLPSAAHCKRDSVFTEYRTSHVCVRDCLHVELLS